MNQNDSGLTLPGNHRLPQQTAGDVTVSGNENPLALVNATGNTAIDQSHYIIYNWQTGFPLAEWGVVVDECD